MIRSDLATAIGGVAVMALAWGCATQGQGQRAASVPQQISQAYGVEALGNVRVLRFDFVVRKEGREVARFKHLWDRETGECRYEADALVFAKAPFFDDSTKKWQPINLELSDGVLVGLVNRNTRQGSVFIGGVEQEDGTLVRRVLERVNNDMLWLMQPLELGGAGTAGETIAVSRDDGTAYNLYRFHYPGDAGATSGDYWALYFDPQTMKVYQSKVRKQNTGKFVAAKWQQEVEIKGVTFVLERVMEDTTLAIENLYLLEAAPLDTFVDPWVSLD